MSLFALGKKWQMFPHNNNKKVQEILSIEAPVISPFHLSSSWKVFIFLKKDIKL